MEWLLFRLSSCASTDPHVPAPTENRFEYCINNKLHEVHPFGGIKFELKKDFEKVRVTII